MVDSMVGRVTMLDLLVVVTGGKVTGAVVVLATVSMTMLGVELGRSIDGPNF
jgi:hypothetical protein